MDCSGLCIVDTEVVGLGHGLQIYREAFLGTINVRCYFSEVSIEKGENLFHFANCRYVLLRCIVSLINIIQICHWEPLQRATMSEIRITVEEFMDGAEDGGDGDDQALDIEG